MKIVIFVIFSPFNSQFVYLPLSTMFLELWRGEILVPCGVSYPVVTYSQNLNFDQIVMNPCFDHYPLSKEASLTTAETCLSINRNIKKATYLCLHLKIHG